MRRSFRFAAFIIVTVSSFVSSAAFAGAPPTRQGDVFVYADGARVRAVDPQGHAGAVQSDGSIRWSDGTSLSHDPASGDTKITRADGSVAQSNSHVPEKQGNAFVYSDGTRVRARIDERQRIEEKLSSVQYLKFPLEGRVPVAIGCDFPEARAEAVLTDVQRRALAEDLAS